MIFTKLSTTDLKVSKACLGTMSFGAHVSQEVAFEIMDQALELGINFFDTAEMYSVPPSQATFGLTEEIIGKWMKSRNARNKIILATKAMGSARKDFEISIPGRELKLDRKNIRLALEGSLQRLGTDFVDLYYLHWPDRIVPKFGERNYIPQKDEVSVPIVETIQALSELQKEGKIRHFGISNETPWGVMEYLRISRELNLPRPVGIQNNYSLITRSYETALAEIGHQENLGLLAYSPLAYGVLGGRYLDGNYPTIGRFTKYPKFVPRYRTPALEALVKKYKALAEENSLTLPQLALAFVYSRSFLTSAIIGPSNVPQLVEDAEAVNIKLSPEILQKIEMIAEESPNLCA